MPNQQLLDYIKQQLQLGASKDQITNSLISTGWQKQDIEEAFSLLSNQDNQTHSSSLPGAIEILKQAWNIYKQRFGTFLGIAIIPILLTAAAMLAIMALSIGSTLLTLLLGFSNASFGIATGGKIASVIFFTLFAIIVIFTQIWAQTALLYAIKDSEEKIGVIEAYRRGWRKILPLWWTSFLMGVIIAGGASFFLIPGILFSLWFSLAPFVLIAEDLKGMDALLKSKEYGRGQWGSLIWRFLFIVIFITVISLIITLISSLISNLLKIRYEKTIVNLIIMLLTPPLTTTYYFLIYNHLKNLKGEFTFSPTKGKKTIYILIGIFGILIIPAIIFLAVFPKYRSMKEKLPSKPLYQQNELLPAPNESPPSLPEETPYY